MGKLLYRNYDLSVFYFSENFQAKPEFPANKKSAPGSGFIVGPAGFEPTHTEPKSVVLPLDDGPK